MHQTKAKMHIWIAFKLLVHVCVSRITHSYKRICMRISSKIAHGHGNTTLCFGRDPDLDSGISFWRILHQWVRAKLWVISSQIHFISFNMKQHIGARFLSLGWGLRLLLYCPGGDCTELTVSNTPAGSESLPSNCAKMTRGGKHGKWNYCEHVLGNTHGTHQHPGSLLSQRMRISSRLCRQLNHLGTLVRKTDR